MREIKYTFNKKILTLALVGVIMVCSSCLIHLYNPLQLLVNKMARIEPGNFLYGLWQAPPYAPTLRFYIFNVTNPQEFLRGEEKLNLTEVGPYCYREHLTHENASFNAEDGTINFNPLRKMTVYPECSIGNASVDRLLVPNIPLIGIQSFLSNSSFITNIGFSSLSATLGAEPFLNLTIEEYLWGYSDKLVSIANEFVPSWIDFGTFGIFERLLSRDNGNNVSIAIYPERRKTRYPNILTENETLADYHIINWNGKQGLPEWGYDSSDEAISSTKRCQLVEGAFDGTFYPRPMTKTSITLFRKAFCRPVSLQFVEEGYTKQGFRSYNYKMPNNMFASPEENKDNECFCFNGECPGKGLQNIGPCYYDIPIVLSQPHFLNSPKEIVESVNGMNPSDEKHSSLAKMQPDIGVPLDESALRIQINLGVKETKFNSKTRPFNGLTLPILWIELSCDELSPLVNFLLRAAVDVAPILQKVVVYLLGILGLAFISGAALLTLFFTKANVPRSLSIASEYSPLPLITIPAQYFKEKDFRISK
uniref:Scavenger receptor class B member 1-like isoform X1 n=1 Tax=Diabrotica virgifera virgifera TaxID=50390 RepID=A0A6P7GJD8_DIAVI